MSRTSLFVLGLGLIAPQLVSGLALQVRQTVTCDFSTAANTGDTCTSFAAEWGLTEAGFEALNPGIVCPNLVGGQDYCVIGDVTSVTTTSTTSTTSTLATTSSIKTTTSTTSSTTTKGPMTTSTTATTTASALPSPTQSGLASNCDAFHLVASGDTCAGIETEYGITAAEFSTWNPAINSSCGNLFLGYYVCVGITGVTTTTAPTTTTTTSATSSGPSPQMPSLISTCDKYYQVASGDGCDSIETAEDITAAEFALWNPYVDTACDNLWLGYYICVGVATVTTTTAPTTTSIATSTGPSPQMPSLISTCDKYYQVASGDGCDSIETKEDITAAEFALWNPYVDAACDNLWLGYYICVGV